MAPQVEDPFRVAERRAARRRKLETVAMIASAFAIAVMTGVFYTLLSR